MISSNLIYVEHIVEAERFAIFYILNERKQQQQQKQTATAPSLALA